MFSLKTSDIKYLFQVKTKKWFVRAMPVYFSCLVCLSSDQSGILHEVYKSGPQLEENTIQKTKWCVWSQNQRGDKVSMSKLCKGNSSDFIADNIAAQNCFHLLNFPHVIRKLTWVHFLFTSSGASAPRCLTSSASALRKWRRGGSTKWESTGSPGWPLISRPSKQHSTPVSPPPTASSQPHDRRTLLTSKRVTYIY